MQFAKDLLGKIIYIQGKPKIKLLQKPKNLGILRMNYKVFRINEIKILICYAMNKAQTHIE